MRHKKSLQAQMYKYSGKKSFLHLLAMSFLKIESKSFSKRHTYFFFTWFRNFMKIVFVALFDLYKSKEQQILTKLNRNFGGVPVNSVENTFSPIIQIPDFKTEILYLQKINNLKTNLSKILWSKYSFKAFHIGSQKLITVLRSPHTDKKARDQFFRKDFSTLGLFPKFFSKQYYYLYKNLFRRSKFLWSSLQQLDIYGGI